MCGFWMLIVFVSGFSENPARVIDGRQRLIHIRLLEQLFNAKPASVMDQIVLFFLLHNYISKFTCRKKGRKAQIASKRIPLCLLNSWVFICEGSPGSMTATCAAYAACANRPMPNRKFLLWNSMTLIQGSLQTAWSDPKSRRAQGDFTRQPWFAHLALTGWYPL